MLKRLLLTSAALLVAGGLMMSPVAHARETGLVGTVTKVEPHAIAVMTDSHETIPVTIDAHTSYLKWIMAKPWEQDIRASARSLRVGQRVYVELAQNNRMTAETVWIVTGRVGVIN